MLERLKITKIEDVKEEKDCYDLTVEDNHNFFLANKILSKNCNYVFASQTINDVNENIIKQCKYIFIPATADLETIKIVLTQSGMVKNQQSAPNQALRLKRMMQKVKYSWIALNRMDGSMELIKPLAPLSWHLETSQ